MQDFTRIYKEVRRDLINDYKEGRWDLITVYKEVRQDLNDYKGGRKNIGRKPEDIRKKYIFYGHFDVRQIWFVNLKMLEKL